MSTISYQDDSLNEVYELSNIIDKYRKSTIAARKSLGDFGVFFAVPCSLFFSTRKLRQNRKEIESFFKDLFNEFSTYDERSQMQIEFKLLAASEELDRKIDPIVDRIKSKNYFFTSMFLKETEKTQILIRNASARLTSIVYPNQIDPASDPRLFQDLVLAYKGVDLSDWKDETNCKSETTHNKHAHV